MYIIMWPLSSQLKRAERWCAVPRCGNGRTWNKCLYESAAELLARTCLSVHTYHTYGQGVCRLIRARASDSMYFILWRPLPFKNKSLPVGLWLVDVLVTTITTIAPPYRYIEERLYTLQQQTCIYHVQATSLILVASQQCHYCGLALYGSTHDIVINYILSEEINVLNIKRSYMA